jgi:hypothetical protein
MKCVGFGYGEKALDFGGCLSLRMQGGENIKRLRKVVRRRKRVVCGDT